MKQIDRLLKHLPNNDELARLDHDALEIKTDARGNLLVRTARSTRSNTTSYGVTRRRTEPPWVRQVCTFLPAPRGRGM
jgi:hypothetical protein